MGVMTHLCITAATYSTTSHLHQDQVILKDLKYTDSRLTICFLLKFQCRCSSIQKIL